MILSRGAFFVQGVVVLREKVEFASRGSDDMDLTLTSPKPYILL